MKTRRAALVVLLGVACLPTSGAVAKPTSGAKATTLEQAIARGVAYLLKAQNKDGSWGSPASNLNDIYAPAPGSQQAFQVGASALALSALIEVDGKTPSTIKAIERAAAWLIRKHGVRRVNAITLYNTWAHAYSLEAFARLLAREKDPKRRAVLLREAQVDVSRLQTFEFVEGGWGYYNFGLKAKSPGPGSTAFTTATGLAALKMAADQGVKIPKRLVARGLTVLRDSRKPDNSYIYSLGWRYRPQGNINQIKGSLARTPACLLATLGFTRRAEERKQLVPHFVEKALDDLETYGHFLRIARKYPVPHETWYQNSGYFCFYGYYYAALLLDYDPLTRRAIHARQIAGHLTPLQEKDGSFWDYQLFQYHKAYGTGFVLMSLGRCRDALAAKSK